MFRGSSCRGEAGAATSPDGLTEPRVRVREEADRFPRPRLASPGPGAGLGRAGAAQPPRIPARCPGPCPRLGAMAEGGGRRGARLAAGRGERGGCGGGGARLSLALLVVTARQARIPSGSRSLSPFCFSTIELRWKQKIEGV